MSRTLKIPLAMVVVAAATAAAAVGATFAEKVGTGAGVTTARQATLHLELTPSTPQLAACMPNARVFVTVRLTTEQFGFDVLTVRARGLPANTDFTLFLLELPTPPFGAAEYIGDFKANAAGNAYVRLKLIVEEAFSSTLVNGQRVRVDLNQLGAWFADPKDDDFCLGPNSPVTPFDGDNEAGVQAFNSAHAQPLP